MYPHKLARALIKLAWAMAENNNATPVLLVLLNRDVAAVAHQIGQGASIYR